METKDKIFITIALFMTIIGFSLSLGSIFSFIAMNVVAPQPLLPDDFVIWQRYFITSIMNYVTVPAMVLFLLGNGLFVFLKGAKKKTITLFLLSVIICINGLFFIVPTAYKANTYTIHKNYLEQHWNAYLIEKSLEDTLGGINMLLLLVYLFIVIYFAINNNLKNMK